MIFSALSDEELLREAANADPLTTSDLQNELARRFANLVDEHAEGEEARQWLEKIDFDPSDAKDRERVAGLLALADEFDRWDIRGLLEALSERDLDNPEALRQVLERDAAMSSLLDDLADPIAKLHQLANPAPADAAPATTA